MIIYISYHNLGISHYTVAETIDLRVVDVLNYQQLLLIGEHMAYSYYL